MRTLLYLPPFNTDPPMMHVWFSIARFMQKSFDLLLVSFGWAPVYIFACVLAFGALYWLNLQAKMTRRAKEKNEYI